MEKVEKSLYDISDFKRSTLRKTESRTLHHFSITHWEIDFQDVYYSLVCETEEKAFAETIKTLEDYFILKANASFESHLFKQMEQGPSEMVHQFVCHLQQRAASCEFGDVDEAICDQLIDCCRSFNLRRKFLEKTRTATLKNLQDISSIGGCLVTQGGILSHNLYGPQRGP